MRWIPRLDDEMSWRDVPGLILGVAVFFGCVWVLNALTRAVAALPLWWRLPAQFAVTMLIFMVVFIILHAKYLRQREVPLGKFISDRARAAAAIAIVVTIASLLPTWVTSAALVLAVIVIGIAARRPARTDATDANDELQH